VLGAEQAGERELRAGAPDGSYAGSSCPWDGSQDEPDSPRVMSSAGPDTVIRAPFVGDVVGPTAVEWLASRLPALRAEHGIDK